MADQGQDDLRAGGSIVTLLTNLWQDNFVTGGIPYVVSPYSPPSPGSPVPFQNTVVQVPLPDFYNPAGDSIYSTGNSNDVPGNTQMDLLRFERDLAALESGPCRFRPITGVGIGPTFGNGYVGTLRPAVERSFSDMTAQRRLCRHCRRQSAAHRLSERLRGSRSVVGAVHDVRRRGLASRAAMGRSLHDQPLALDLSFAPDLGLEELPCAVGLGFQASYTFSKSIDDTSAVLGGFLNPRSGTILQASAQDPNNIRAEKAPSTFDITQAFSFSVIQEFRTRPRCRRHCALGTRLTRGGS